MRTALEDRTEPERAAATAAPRTPPASQFASSRRLLIATQLGLGCELAAERPRTGLERLAQPPRPGAAVGRRGASAGSAAERVPRWSGFRRQGVHAARGGRGGRAAARRARRKLVAGACDRRRGRKAAGVGLAPRRRQRVPALRPGRGVPATTGANATGGCSAAAPASGAAARPGGSTTPFGTCCRERRRSGCGAATCASRRAPRFPRWPVETLPARLPRRCSPSILADVAGEPVATDRARGPRSTHGRWC